MKNLLFLAPYPDQNNSKDGMISRVKYIDSVFINRERSYLDIHLLKTGKGNSSINQLHIFDLNLFLNLFSIIRLIRKADFIYCHSLYSIRYICFLLLLKKKGKIVLDIHGVVPEEEKYFYNNKLRSRYFQLIEKVIFSRLNIAICVTKIMENEYRKRYKSAKCKYLIYGIIPIELLNTTLMPSIAYNTSDIVEIIYSGGIQQWQNIGLMMNTIKKNLQKNIHYTILTGNVDYVKSISHKLNIDEKYLSITSCDSSELAYYYKKAHYAFILRDDSIVNRVANPTKLIEYLFYGLTPIVLNPVIGDYYALGYKYVQLNDFCPQNIFPNKSEVNKTIALEFINSNKSINLLDTLLSSFSN